MQARLLWQPDGAPGCAVLLPADREYDLGRTDHSVLFQVDYDQSALASMLGGGLCKCGSSDGTVSCACGTLDEHIAHNIKWLREHSGETFDDPGYLEVPEDEPKPDASGHAAGGLGCGHDCPYHGGDPFQ